MPKLLRPLKYIIPKKYRSLFCRPRLPKSLTFVARSIYLAFLLALSLFTALTVFTAITLDFPLAEQQATVAPFPIGVNPATKVIVENPELQKFIANKGQSRWSIVSLDPSGRFARFIAKLSRSAWYQMAIPGGRLLVAFPGERKEEIVKSFGDILRWDKTERNQFIALVTEATPELTEGQFYPERYLVAVDASPEDVAKMVVDRFDAEVVARYHDGPSDRLPMKDALIIASLLEREAYDFTDMREISGVIWNRLFIDMPLQLDATLQYARGSQAYETKWWPTPTPADKHINSPYNTYQNKGLPPEPIANPSVEAILAALNPASTDCLFYFHDSQANFHCSPTYEGHVAKLKEIYGRGR